MSRRITVFVLAVALIMANAVMAKIATSIKAPTKVAVIGGANEPYDASRGPVDPRTVRDHSRTLDEVYQAGTTYYDYQHNGTAGKMIGVDDLGYVQVNWMNGLTSELAGPRHVFWNGWDPSSGEFLDATGRQANSSNRAGYISSYTNHEGWNFPCFHEIVPGDAGPHSAAGIDYLPFSGAFTISQPAWFEDPDPAQNGLLQSIWPKIAVTWNPDTIVHMVSTESPLSGVAGDPQTNHYSRGIPVFDEFGSGVEIEWQPVEGDLEYMEVDLVMTIAADIAASRSGDRVAMAWAHPIDDPTDPNTSNQINNDCFIMISEDGGLTWGEPINITSFPTPDFDCPSGDSVACNLDTFRLYTDCTIFFDEDDFIHVGFSTRTYYGVGAIDPDGIMNPGPLSWIDQSGIWHWGEEFEEFTPVMNEYYFFEIDGAISDVGAWQLNVQRPTFAQDPETGYLYCSMMRYDSNQYSDAFWHMADAWVAGSCNGGRSWGTPVNVTDTDGGEGTPPPGSLSERDITLSDLVTYENGVGYLHMQYVLDLDAGGIPQNEGTATLNPVMYQRIPVSDIPIELDAENLWPAFHVDSTGFPGRDFPLGPCGNAADPNRPTLQPESFTLYQNYPNPFNPSTKILFDLNRDAFVSLKVYNVMGQEVATMFDNKFMHAGAQVADFDASSLSSGVYMYKLTVGDQNVTRKMVLMK